MSRKDLHVANRKEALCTIMHLALDAEDLFECASGIVHPIVRLLSENVISLQIRVLVSLTILAYRLGNFFNPFILPIRRNLNMISKDPRILPYISQYESIVNLLIKNRPLPSTPPDTKDIIFQNLDKIKLRTKNAKPSTESNQVNVQALETAWAVSGRMTASDISQWMHRLSMELLRQSPSSILRQCASLAKSFRPLANDLFNISFSSMWDELFASETCKLVTNIPLITNLELALQSSQIPSSIALTLLNLGEFMEILDKPLPMDIQILARAAASVENFSNCLYYREIEFNSKNVRPSSECIESLITVNNKLGAIDAASGILQCVKSKYPDISVKPLWLEKLSRWDEARDAYLSELSNWRSDYPDNSPPQHKVFVFLYCLFILFMFFVYKLFFF
jgi:FKBP12-rapamycin complex-associated protein